MDDKTPLFDALKQLSEADRVSFHMPGSRGGRAFPFPFDQGFARLETTELRVSDDLNEPCGPALRAEEAAARFFKAAKTFFFTSGSSTAIHAAAAAVCPQGSRLLVTPCAHRSLAYAAVLLDLELCFMPLRQPDEAHLCDSRSPFPEIDAEAAAAMLREGGFSAVFLTSPDYYGRCDLPPELISEAHEQGVPVICDEAHGAHFETDRLLFPLSAIERGVDIAVQSMHKTLPALASASLLHLSEAALKRDPGLADRVKLTRKLFQTSSPSFPIAASIDYARAYAESVQMQGDIKRCLRCIAAMDKALPEGFKVYKAKDDEDPFRVVISFAESGIQREVLLKALEREGIDIEMSDFRRLVLIVTPGQAEEDFMRLAGCLQGVARRRGGAVQADAGFSPTERSLYRCLTRRRGPIRPRSPYLNGLFQNSEAALTPESLRETAALLREKGGTVTAEDCIAPYPPGIPLFYPGEQACADQLELLAELCEQGFFIPNLRFSRSIQ